MLSTNNINRDLVCVSLRDLLRHLRRRLIVFLDNSATHRGAPMREFFREHPRLRLKCLPAYAPELNPDDGVWSAMAGVMVMQGREVSGAYAAAEAGT